jgi:predicted O-methyltransferase YrrM
MLKYVFNNVEPRVDIPLRNVYTFNTMNDAVLEGTLYYVDESNFKAVIRRTDKPIGWGDFTITIHNLSGETKQDMILYNSGEGNCHTGTYRTKVPLEKVTFNPQKIPKILFQTTESKSTDNLTEYNSIATIIDANPEYTYVHFDSCERRAFIQRTFSENVLDTYDELVFTTTKIDFFRYCFLLAHGGCFIDGIKVPLRDMIKEEQVCNTKLTFSVAGHIEIQKILEKYVSEKQQGFLYKNKVIAGKYIIYIYPCQENTVFNFWTFGDSGVIAQSQEPWKHNLKVKVIDTETHTENILEIGSSAIPIKMVMMNPPEKEDDSALFEKIFSNVGRKHFDNISKIVKRHTCFAEGNIITDGYSYEINKDYTEKRYNLFSLAKKAQNIMEIGFNAGHSALIYLLANDTSKIQFFDLKYHDYAQPCFEYLDKEFPGRMSIVWGDSKETIPKFTTDIKYDLVHIDGGHTVEGALLDILNCKTLTNTDSIVIFDDTDLSRLYTLSRNLFAIGFIKEVKLPYYTHCHVGFKYNF